MNAELQKLRGLSIRVGKEQLTLKEYVRPSKSQFDQIYFKTSRPDILLKIYDLEKAVSQYRYQNQICQYQQAVLPHLCKNVHSEIVKIKKKQYGLLSFVGLGLATPLNQIVEGLNESQIQKLTECLLETLIDLKGKGLVYCNFRLENIYRYNDSFVFINAEYMKRNCKKQENDYFFLQVMEKDWEYWAPQILDTYSNSSLDYSLDLFAIGCVLYQVMTRGKFPFESKLNSLSHTYERIQEKGIVGYFVNTSLDSAQVRRKMSLNQLLKTLKAKLKKSETKEGVETFSFSKNTNYQHKQQKKMRSGSGSGIFEGISNALTKMMNDTEGNLLNYIENDCKAPEQKYLEKILYKIYRNEGKNDKIVPLILKFIKTNEEKFYSIMKIILLIGNIVRKGPTTSLSIFHESQCLETASILFKNRKQISSFAEIIIHRLKVQQKVKKCLKGNFYLDDICDFRQLSVGDLSEMIVYLQKLISFLRNKIKEKQYQEEIFDCIVNFVCDDIFDLTSMIILSIISIRNDNLLQLRNDNMKDLMPIERMIKSSLKSISDLSNYVGAHAIYSLERDYIAYQEEINLKVNPYYTTMEFFYRSSRMYKGLSIPEDYEAIYGNKGEKKGPQEGLRENTKVEQVNKEYFFRAGAESDEEENKPQAIFDDFLSLTQNKDSPIKKQLKGKGNNFNSGQNEKLKLEARTKDDEKSSKGSKKESVSTNKSISFAQFGKIGKQSKKQKESSPKKFEDFDFFADFNDKTKEKQIKSNNQSRPPHPMKQGVQKEAKKAAKKELFGFDCFTPVTKEENKNNAMNLLDGFQDFGKITKVKSDPPLVEKQKIYENLFGNKNEGNSNISPFEESALEKIMKGLKLKELKILLKKNQKLLIPFSSLTFSKQIGSGSAGEVYLGKYETKSIAIKKVKAKENPNALKQFQRELVTYIKIGINPFLVSLVGLSEQNGDYYLITEFCSQGSLFDLLHKRKQITLSWSQRLRFAIQIAEGMKCLHQMKPIIIHRDLKSLNIFVSKQNGGFIMKVADFGLSRSPEAEMMTTQLGTIHWMAPELLQGKQYSLKVDIYSYGILLWEILSRKTPYSNLQNIMGIIKHVAIDQKRPQVDVIELQCPHQLIQIMEKCWGQNPNTRPDFSQIINLLKKVKVE